MRWISAKLCKESLRVMVKPVALAEFANVFANDCKSPDVTKRKNAMSNHS